MSENTVPGDSVAKDNVATDDVVAQMSMFTPAMAPPELPASDVSYVVADTAIGRILLACNQTGALISSAFVPDGGVEDAWLHRLARQVSPRVLRQPRALDPARRELDAYLRGERRDIDLPTNLILATPFQRVVLGRLAGAVAYGHRTTYGALAQQINRPSASRAVGAALGANPLCVVLPCHRVVASSGALTGYAGGLAAKRYLLELESRP
jgi:methylated-DNA-[protein]-cysteine S-methyltransferase